MKYTKKNQKNQKNIKRNYNKNSKKISKYSDVKYEFVTKGQGGCIYKIISKKVPQFIRKITFFNYNELKINQKILKASKLNPSLHNHIVIIKNYKIVNEIPKQMIENHCDAKRLINYKNNGDDNKKYLILDLPIEGQPLVEKIKYYLNNNTVLINLINKALKSIQSLHNIGIYHGDLHFANILINESDQIKLLDFEYSGESKTKTPGDLFRLFFIRPMVLKLFKKNKNDIILKELNKNKNIMYNIDILYFIISTLIDINKSKLSDNEIIEILRWDEPKYTYETAVKPYLDIESL
jgi:serine/threonine protein kinase